MKPELKHQVLKKIEEIYPRFKKDAVVLFGSRACGLEVATSDIDMAIFTDNSKSYQEISIKKGFRKRAEDGGFEIQLENGLLLEVKIHDYHIGRLDIFWVNDLLNSEVIIPNKKFSAYKNKIQKQFLKNYDKILMKAYIHFYNELKQMEGMSKRKDEFSKTNFFIKKGIVLQAFLRLILIMQKKPYPCDKWLYHFVAKTEYYSKIKDFVPKLEKIESYDNVDAWKKEVRNFIDPNMPKKPYVGNWWKYLKPFKELE